MAPNIRRKSALDRQYWQKILKALVEMLQTQQTQLKGLTSERKLLEDRIRTQHNRWVSDVRFLEDEISQMKGDLLVRDMAGWLEVSRLEMVMGLTRREAHVNKLRSEYAQTDLEDFKVFFELKCSEPKSRVRCGNKKASKNTEEHRSEKLESEIRRLKQEYEKLSLEKKSEVSALLEEKTFVWNQFKTLETNLRSKNSEIEQVDEKLRELIFGMEQLQSSNSEKDDCIATLSSQLIKMKEASDKLIVETGRLSQKVDLEKSRDASVKPVSTTCPTRTKKSSWPGKNSDTESTELFEKGGRRSKRKADDVVSSSETPKLFSPKFKVPKLKSLHPL